MPLRPEDIAHAEELQLGAAHDRSAAVRLVAGPGTGKSASIEERFRWMYADLLIEPREVFGVSFTRAASRDLQLRVAKYCVKHQVAIDPSEIRISTLHSLAMSLLARANMLQVYPVRPLVLDEWEVESIFDAEFAALSGWSPSRCEDIRKANEAFWSTGEWNPASYIQPSPPITDEELQRFRSFHTPTTQTYSCVLPGEIVRLCVRQMHAGLLDVADLTSMTQLVIDEYQDLNPMDIEFVDLVARQGVAVFAAGDDDQSVYAFRFASPAGLQDFPDRHPEVGDHVLEGCFRCAVEIAGAANTLIADFSPTSRIPKELQSLWGTAVPMQEGVVCRWRFAYHTREAVAIADSCQALVAAGVPAADIMILLSNKRIFARIKRELDASAVPYTPPKEDSWRNTDAGRFMLGMVRIACSGDDYIALRLVLGCRRGVGARTCAEIVERAANRNLAFRDLFYEALPQGTFGARQTAALIRAQEVCETLSEFTSETSLADSTGALRDLLVAARTEAEATEWDRLVDMLPADTSLNELRDFLWADNVENSTGLSSRFMNGWSSRHQRSQPMAGYV